MEKVSSEHQCAVDVRDVGFAHLQAIKVPAAANRRFILVHSSPSFIEYAQSVNEKYAPLGWPICQTLAEVNPNEVWSKFNNSASREVLGVTYGDWSKTMVDMADKMVELGSVTKDLPVSPAQ